MNFLSRKIHLKLLQCSLDQENDYSNFKRKFGKVLHIENQLELVFWAYSPESVGASFLGLLSKIYI